MNNNKVSRRGLFRWLRRDEPPEGELPFLERFYAGRPAAPPDLPAVRLRGGLPSIETSSVGVTRPAKSETP